MNNIDLMNYWIKSSDKDYDVMLDLKEKNRNTYALFFGQLLIEKLLKAYYAKINKNTPYAPRTHELAYLANKMNLKLTERQEDLLETISGFNMEARYGDYKYTFELKCNDEYTDLWIENVKELREWLKELLMEK